jgi:hypothetical protein
VIEVPPTDRPGESRIEALERQVSDSDATIHATAAAIKIAEGRYAELLASQRELLDARERTDVVLDAQSACLVLLARHLGIDDRLPPAVARSEPPPPLGRAPERRALLPRIAHDAYRSKAWTVAAVILLSLELALEVLRRFH